MSKRSHAYALLVLGCAAIVGLSAQAEPSAANAQKSDTPAKTAPARTAPARSQPAANAAKPAVAKPAAKVTKATKAPTPARNAPARSQPRPASRKSPSTNAPAATQGVLLKQILASKLIRVCVRTDIPPFGFLKGRTLQGFDLALTEEIATQISIRHQLQLKVDWVIVRASDRSKSLKDGRCDMVVAAFSKTARRAQQISFSTVYHKTRKALLKRSGDVSSKPIIAQVRKTTGAALNLANATYTSFLTYRDILYTMHQKLVDYVVADHPTARYLARHSQGAYQVHQILGQEELYSIGVAKSSTELLKEINNALQQLRRSGRLAFLHKKWL